MLFFGLGPTCGLSRFGASVIVIMRPSSVGGRSTTATSDSSSANLASISLALCWLNSLALMSHLSYGSSGDSHPRPFRAPAAFETALVTWTSS